MSIEDIAQDHEAAEWERRQVVRPAQAMYEPGSPGFGPESCDRCDADMPLLRRAHGWRLCTKCKTADEQRRK